MASNYDDKKHQKYIQTEVFHSYRQFTLLLLVEFCEEAGGCD